MDVIPAIDLLHGQAVRLTQGDYTQAEVVALDPIAQALTWVEQGAPRLHLVDLDGAKAASPLNLPIIQKIVEQVTIPVQVGGGIRSLAIAEHLFALGVTQVIVGTLAVEDLDLLALLCDRHPGRILVGIDARQGLVATRGWIESTPLRATDLAQQVSAVGAAGIIYTDIQRDGTLQGPNLGQLREMAQIVTVPLTASGGISSTADLLSLLTLEPLGVTGVIVGKALYAGAFSLREAIRAVGSGRWQDIPPDNGIRVV
jgi:phosphoribosylformimino-5-aminoimidazole carboxamide ribotide isomerase